MHLYGKICEVELSYLRNDDFWYVGLYPYS